MLKHKKYLLLLLCFIACLIVNAQLPDWRNIENALSVIPDEGYCDQPYAVVNKNGEWVIVMTTGTDL